VCHIIDIRDIEESPVTGGSNPGPRRRFADLAPAWISAIAALIGSLVAAGAFLVGRATAPANGAQATQLPTTAPAESSGRTTGTQQAGATLVRYKVDVPEGYGVDIAATAQRPRPGVPGDASLVVPDIAAQLSVSDGGQLAQLDSSVTPGFEACAANTRFTDALYLSRGDSFCYAGHGLLAGVTVKNKVIDVNGSYFTLDIVVWKAP
jgi:hypothetical protein